MVPKVKMQRKPGTNRLTDMPVNRVAIAKVTKLNKPAPKIPIHEENAADEKASNGQFHVPDFARKGVNGLDQPSSPLPRIRTAARHSIRIPPPRRTAIQSSDNAKVDLEGSFVEGA